MKYKAIDGKIFDNEEECLKYESYPTLWFVECDFTLYTSGRENIKDTSAEIFLTKEEAVSCAKKKSSNGGNFHYTYFARVFPPYVEKTLIPKINTVFDAGLVVEKAKEKNKKEEKRIEEARKTAWEKILSYFS